MIIDFHTHIFPDRIAEKTISYLSEKGGIPPFSDGSELGLLEAMTRAGVDVSVTLPVVTNPSQFESINTYAEQINRRYGCAEGKRLISLGGIHPGCEDIEGKMHELHERGFLGVKIHPDYQGRFINDDGYFRILQAAEQHGMIVVTHAGVDCGFPESPVRCTPERVLDLISAVPHSRFVLAHMGGNELWEEVYEQLSGKDVYFDTAYLLRFIGKENFLKILKKHGSDRILFASDSPWSSMEGDVRLLKEYVSDKEDLDRIYYKNAEALLGF